MLLTSKNAVANLVIGLLILLFVLASNGNQARQVGSIGKNCPDNFQPSVALYSGNTYYWAGIPRDGQVHYFGNSICMTGDSKTAYCFNCIDLHTISRLFIPGNMNPCMVVKDTIEGIGGVELRGAYTGNQGEERWVQFGQDGTVQGIICNFSKE